MLNLTWTPRSLDIVPGQHVLSIAYNSPSKLLDYANSPVFDLVSASEDVNVTLVWPFGGEMLEVDKVYR